MKEKEIQKYMEKLGISKEEAEQLWKDDHEDFESPEMKEMGRKAKQIGRREKSDTPRKKVVKERKVDEDKKEIIQTLDDALCCLVDNVYEVRNESEIRFEYNDYHYSVKLIRHRAPK